MYIFHSQYISTRIILSDICVLFFCDELYILKSNILMFCVIKFTKLVAKKHEQLCKILYIYLIETPLYY